MVDGLSLRSPPPTWPTRSAPSRRRSPRSRSSTASRRWPVEELSGPAGSVGQVREVAARLAEVAKAGSTCIALVGHVTKEGTVAGPRTLEHLVDAVLYLEGERLGATRLLRAAKNRFGSTDEVGVLEMRGDGLVEVADASRFFLESEQPPVAGSAVTIALEGTRPLAVEIQALVAPAGYGLAAPRHDRDRTNRLLMLIAVLARHAGLNLTGHDVYVNVAGGLRIDESGRRPGRRGGAGLEPPRAAGARRPGDRRRGGAVRPAPRRRHARERRLAEARRLGFDAAADRARRVAHRRSPAVGTATDMREALRIALVEPADPPAIAGRPLPGCRDGC